MSSNTEYDNDDYVTRVLINPDEVSAADWNTLLEQQPGGSASGPFVRHEYLHALHHSGSAVPEAGWALQWITLWRGNTLEAAAPLYIKNHSYGEYVFDWAWANAYAQHGLPYYPKAVVAVPFTPVPGPRLLARSAAARRALVQALKRHAQAEDWSSVHVLFAPPADMEAAGAAGLMPRQTVQFHWHNVVPGGGGAEGSATAQFQDFGHFLASLSQDKRKKIKQERRRVAEAGITFAALRGAEIQSTDWDFFYRCYARTYYEHGNPPYLSRDFFHRLAQTQPGYWLLFIAHNAQGERVACSLIALSDTSPNPQAAYGRYWGALQRVDCLHFEACYYQPLAWCMAHGVQRFEGGAQGEHKMARALLPTATHSAHWLAHPAFSDAVERFLEREGEGVAQYLDHLEQRSPFKQPG